MTPIKEAFEALLPEPAGFRTRYRSEPGMIGHYPWTYADVERRRPKYDRPECEYENIYTADQMRQMFDAATERAAKMAFINALDKAYDAMFDLRGDKVTRFDAQTAIQKLRDTRAAASASPLGKGDGK